MQPTEPGSAQPFRESAPGVNCTRCGRPLDASAVLYSEEGTVVCAACSSSEQITMGETRAVNGLKSAAYGAAVIGMISVCFDPFFITSIMAVTSGIGTLAWLVRDPAFRKKLGGQLIPVIIAASVGILGGATVPMLLVLGVGLSALR